MEMHTIDSLRRVHRINARKVRTSAPVHKLTYVDCYQLASRERNKAIVKLVSAAWISGAEFVRNIVIAPIRREFRLRNDTRLLMQMTDRQLADLGITRGDIKYVVRNGKPSAF